MSAPPPVCTDCGERPRARYRMHGRDYQRPVLGGVARAVGLGCLRTIRPDEVRWLQGNEAGWAHGFAVFSVLDGSVHVEEVRPVRGQAVFRGELVGSRLEVPDGSAS